VVSRSTTVQRPNTCPIKFARLMGTFSAFRAETKE
jgi:hypothetical protein